MDGLGVLVAHTDVCWSEKSTRVNGGAGSTVVRRNARLARESIKQKENSYHFEFFPLDWTKANRTEKGNDRDKV